MYYTEGAVPRVAHIFALAGLLIVSPCLCRPDSIPTHNAESFPGREKTLVIFLTSDAIISAAASSELKREVSYLLRPAAIRVDWRDPAVDRGGLENDYSALVHLRGSCRPADAITRFEHAVSGPFTLASSPVADGVILPFGDIDCAALNAFLGPSLWKEPDKVREFAYGRAIARLMAHELYHMIGQTRVHARSGIAESDFTVAELLSDHFEFTESTLAELHTSPEAGEYTARPDSDESAGK